MGARSGHDSRAWLEVDEGAPARNLQALREHARPPGGELPPVIAMVKADGYGIGIRHLVRGLALDALPPGGPATGEPPDASYVLPPTGIVALGVAALSEARELRELGIRCPILLFSPVLPREAGAVLDADVIPMVSELPFARALAGEARRRGIRADFHVEVDTGIGRSGLPAREVEAWGPDLLSLCGVGSGAGEGRGEGDPADGAAGDTPAGTAGGAAGDAPLRWAGLAHHFHSPDDAPGTMAAQEEAFAGVAAHLRRQGLAVPGEDGGEGLLVHRRSAAAAYREPARPREAIRPGIILVGGRAAPDLPVPEPVVALRTRVVSIREVPPGATVGYGATYRAERRERWATLPVGYGDGLPRALSNRGRVLLDGGEAPVVGRISMDLVVVDITDLPAVSVGDLVTVLGRHGEMEISLDEIAGHAGTISYEVLTGLGKRLPRVPLPSTPPAT
ncbi:MAG: alanine racemase [Gemmatimonadales bacterium]|nr:MAG: alanine racemase [Gemmatimonadales bacterium]